MTLRGKGRLQRFGVPKRVCGTEYPCPQALETAVPCVHPSENFPGKFSCGGTNGERCDLGHDAELGLAVEGSRHELATGSH